MAQSLEDTVKEAEKIYAEAMAKLKELRGAHAVILERAKERVKKQKLDELAAGIKGA